MKASCSAHSRALLSNMAPLTSTRADGRARTIWPLRGPHTRFECDNFAYPSQPFTVDCIWCARRGRASPITPPAPPRSLADRR